MNIFQRVWAALNPPKEEPPAWNDDFEEDFSYEREPQGGGDNVIMHAPEDEFLVVWCDYNGPMQLALALNQRVFRTNPNTFQIRIPEDYRLVTMIPQTVEQTYDSTERPGMVLRSSMLIWQRIDRSSITFPLDKDQAALVTYQSAHPDMAKQISDLRCELVKAKGDATRKELLLNEEKKRNYRNESETVRLNLANSQLLEDNRRLKEQVHKVCE